MTQHQADVLDCLRRGGHILRIANWDHTDDNLIGRSGLVVTNIRRRTTERLIALGLIEMVDNVARAKKEDA